MSENRPIEKLLKDYANKRQEEAAPSGGIPPATRELLQAEVKRTYANQQPKPDTQHSPGWFQVLVLAWPRLVPALGICLVIGFGQGCGSVAAPSLQADVIDWDARRTGERKEGAYFAAWNLAMKAASAGAVAIAGIGLDLAGFVAGAQQPPGVVLAIRFLAGALPALIMIAAILLLRGFQLDPGPQEQAGGSTRWHPRP